MSVMRIAPEASSLPPSWIKVTRDTTSNDRLPSRLTQENLCPHR